MATVVGLGLGTLWLARGGGPKPSVPIEAPQAVAAQPPALPTPARVHWSIASDPPGAEVVRAVGDEVLGTTPFQQERPAGTGSEQVKLRLAGYQEILLTVPLNRDVAVDRSLIALPKEAPPPPPEPVKPAAPPTKKGPPPKKGPTKGKPPAKKPTPGPGVF